MYDGHMKVLFLAAAALASAFAAGLDEIKTVYMLPMSNGLDQFLAMRLTHGALLQVVTDPQKADAIFTDRIGASFEQKFDELYGAKDKPKDEKVTGMQVGSSKGRGAIFLVDRKTRNVIWTDYEKPGGTTPQDMNRTAERITDKLQKEIKPKSN
jgi:hypothetical protein